MALPIIKEVVNLSETIYKTFMYITEVTGATEVAKGSADFVKV